ncbi:hypothetical protein AZE42_04263 [Rhizopogon vesiculosus]|uniref:Uncharacterized protein n=1 Tax=Rhizopogon vesiculosus TaxID=180088 RepID=A0A1J8PNP7_9AGAM|nr:hypothetical protein AZE42_04263 [Rhizopogon vesiculosus]
MPLSIEQMLQSLEISGSFNRTSSINQMLQNLQISVSTSLRSSTKPPQINIQCPPRQDVRQHYGYRLDERHMLYLEDILKQYIPDSDPTKVPMQMTLISDWIVEELQLYQLD